jgi:choline dehydrogenase-like flavoprotein
MLVNSPRIKQIYGGVSATTGRWAYHINSVPQPNLNNRSIVVTVGNLVGGSSAINAKLTIRGTSDDYNRWGSFFGKDSSWSWEGLLPYFKKVRCPLHSYSKKCSKGQRLSTFRPPMMPSPNPPTLLGILRIGVTARQYTLLGRISSGLP